MPTPAATGFALPSTAKRKMAKSRWVLFIRLFLPIGRSGRLPSFYHMTGFRDDATSANK
jgi:hypothetical protein